MSDIDDDAIVGPIILPCAPQSYATPALTVLFVGVAVVFFGLYATGREGFPQVFETASGLGLSLMCLGFSFLLDSRPPSNLEFDIGARRLVIRESFFVRAMPSVAVPYAAIERMEIGEPGFRRRVPVRILLKNGGSMTFRITGSEQPIDEQFTSKVGLASVSEDTSEDLVLPYAPAGESDATAGLLREFDGNGEVSLVWKPKAFGRAIRFRLLSVLSLVLVAWALRGEVDPAIPAVILAIVAVGTVVVLYRLALTQRREFVAYVDPEALSIRSRGIGYSVTIPRDEFVRCGSFLDPDDPVRYLDVHGPDPEKFAGGPIRPAIDADGATVGVRIPIGRLTYGEAIGLAGRIEAALRTTVEQMQGEETTGEPATGEQA